MATRGEYEGGATNFLNVDLEVFSRESLAPFAKALGRRVHVLHEGRWSRQYAACIELWGSGRGQSPDTIIRRMIRLVRRLPRSARRLWVQARVKQFNIGIEAGTRPRSCEFPLAPDVVLDAGRLGARIVITVYAAEAMTVPERTRPEGPKRSRARLLRPPSGSC